MISAARSVSCLPAASSVLDQARTLQDLSRGAGGRPGAIVTTRQPGDQLLGSPGGMAASRLGQKLDDPRLGSMRAVARSSGPILQTVEAFLFVTLGPFVPGHPADPVALAQPRHREQLSLEISNEPYALSHLGRLAPGHPAPPLVPHPVRNCQPCSRFIL